MRVEYSANNSGGRWWLKDKDWLALRTSGWILHDYAYDAARYAENMKKDPAEFGKYNPLDWWDKAADADGTRRYMGCIAKAAHKEFETPGDAMREFERITGQSVSDEGCNCCGAPHSFRWGCATDDDCGCPPRTPHKNYGSAYGENCLGYLFPNVEPTDLRGAYEAASKRGSRG